MRGKTKGTPQDYKAAFKWHSKAAEQGDAEAQYNLGVSFNRGLGTPQDYVMAHMFFNIANANGQEPPDEWRDLVAKEMTSSQIEKAQDLDRKWMESH